jgi:hypothetical protein
MYWLLRRVRTCTHRFNSACKHESYILRAFALVVPLTGPLLAQDLGRYTPTALSCSDAQAERSGFSHVERRNGIDIWIKYTAGDQAAQMILSDRSQCFISILIDRRNGLYGSRDPARAYTWLNASDHFTFSPFFTLKEHNRDSATETHRIDLAHISISACGNEAHAANSEGPSGSVAKCQERNMLRLLRQTWVLQVDLQRGSSSKMISVIFFAGHLMGYDYDTEQGANSKDGYVIFKRASSE